MSNQKIKFIIATICLYFFNGFLAFAENYLCEEKKSGEEKKGVFGLGFMGLGGGKRRRRKRTRRRRKKSKRRKKKSRKKTKRIR